MLSVHELRPPARRAYMHTVRDCASPPHAAREATASGGLVKEIRGLSLALCPQVDQAVRTVQLCWLQLVCAHWEGSMR